MSDDTTVTANRWKCVCENDAGKASGKKLSPREKERKLRDEKLAEMRARRQTFYMPPTVSLDEDVDRFAKASPIFAAWEIRGLRVENVNQQNALAHLYDRLRWLVAERDALELALAEERKDREVAENQCRLSDQALSERCKQLDEARRQLRDRGVKKTKK